MTGRAPPSCSDRWPSGTRAQDRCYDGEEGGGGGTQTTTVQPQDTTEYGHQTLRHTQTKLSTVELRHVGFASRRAMEWIHQTYDYISNVQQLLLDLFERLQGVPIVGAVRG